MSKDFSQSSTTPDSSAQRARQRIDQMAFAAAVTGDNDPLSENSQLAATVKAAAAQADALRTKKQELLNSGLYTAEGVDAELADAKAKALKQAEAVRASLHAKAEPILAQANTIANPVIEFGPEQQATLKMFQDLPEEKRREVKRDTLLGRNPDLAKALVGAPQWATGISKHDRGMLTRQCADPANLSKVDATTERAKQHRRALSAVDSVIAQLKLT